MAFYSSLSSQFMNEINVINNTCYISLWSYLKPFLLLRLSPDQG